MFTPGPAKLYLLGVSVGGGRAAGLLIALGIYTSDLAHVSLSASGAQALFTAYPGVFTAFRFVGAAYLLYLAYGSFARARKPPTLTTPEKAEVQSEGLAKFYLSGLLINLFNPLAVVFYLSLLPQFVSAELSLSAGRQMLSAGVVMVTGFFVFHSLIALAAGALQMQLSGSRGTRFARIQAVVVGLVFCALALRVLTQ